MKKLKKYCFNWLIVIVWMIIIFLLSNMNTNASNRKSKELISIFVEKVVKEDKETNIIAENETNELANEGNQKEKQVSKLTDDLNTPFRKCMHATVYFILAILIMNALNNGQRSKIKILLLTLLICFLYSCTDEYHQTFVDGRTGQFSDCIIDTFGATLGSLFFIGASKIIRKSKNKNEAV